MHWSLLRGSVGCITGSLSSCPHPFSCLPAAMAEDICMFFFATADSGLAAEEAARDKAKAASGAAVPTGG